MPVNLLIQLGQWSTDLFKLSRKLAWIGRWLVLTRSRVFFCLFKLPYAAWWHRESENSVQVFWSLLMLYFWVCQNWGHIPSVSTFFFQCIFSCFTCLLAYSNQHEASFADNKSTFCWTMIYYSPLFLVQWFLDRLLLWTIAIQPH